MKKVRRIKTIGIMSVLILLIGILLIPAIAKDNTDIKYLSDMEATKNEDCLLYLNDITERDTTIKVGGVEYEKGVLTHPGQNGPSILTYNIENLGYITFYAVGGKDASGGFQVGGDPGIIGTKVQLQVFVDGELKADSGELAYPDRYIFNVNIKGAKELKLVTFDGGDGIFCDATSWANAQLLKSNTDIPKEQTPEPTPEPTPAPTQNPEFKNTETVYISDMVIRDFTAHNDVIGLDENIIYEELFINMDSYEKGISIHAVSGVKNAFAEIEVDGLGFKTFSSYIGVCYTMGSDCSMGTIVCKVYCDDVLKYESGIIKATNDDGELTDPIFIQVDITDAKILRLEVSPADDGIAGDMSCWGSACVSKLTDAKEIYKTPVPTATAELKATANKTATNKPTVTEKTNTSDNSDGEGSVNGTKFIIIIVVIALIAAAVIFIILKKRGRLK